MLAVFQGILDGLANNRAHAMRGAERQDGGPGVFHLPCHRHTGGAQVFGNLRAQVGQHFVQPKFGVRGVVDDVAQVGQRFADHHVLAGDPPAVERAHQLQTDIAMDVAGNALALLRDPFS
ncbi:hypothetical protein [Sinisalibacter lacisalsi]|uniref:Uncharacterized protein n=1 Tax=Sinisalibacter lacisalsi TaxID=1526570 RepID=A0ABQ1QJZ1_9RHOB|nr:hypothetical protein [Sinisalibacter lacisalsi]GGD28641.1 hypothetical protein GCM10011358_10980 [Sinisalibacter lacisalsi]